MKRPLLSKSSLMAVALAAAVLVWMLTGLGGSVPSSAVPQERVADGAPRGPETGPIASGDASAGARQTASGAPADALRVTVQTSTAELIVRDIVVSGRTEPSRAVEIKAETEGRVVELGAERGSVVAEGEPIAVLDVRDRRARIEEAEALIAQRQLQYEAAMRLEGRQLIAEVQIAEAKAQLATAEALLEQIRLDLARTTLAAPFDGVLEEREVELGDYVGIGDMVAQVVDNDPLIAVGEVSEREIGELEVGTPGRAQLVSGKIIDGTLRYVSPVADPSTRTFRIELAIPNESNRFPAGMTAEMRLPAGEVQAHFLSPALLTLDDEGNIGVKAVDGENKVGFHEVTLVRSASDGMWVTGLPDELLVITVGQGFVAVGETVQPVHADQH